MSATMLYCPICPFELPPNTGIKNKCPECGSALRLWNTSDGTRPGERSGNLYKPADTIEDKDA